MKTKKEIPEPIKRIIFISITIVLFFGVGVIAGNIKPINTIKIAFSNNHEINVLTTKNTVEEILKENHIEVLEDQIVVPSLETQINENTTIKILNSNEINTVSVLAAKGENISIEELNKLYSPITEKIIVEKIEIPYETITKDISNSSSDVKEQVLTEGENGLKEIKYKVRYQNDVEISRQELETKVVKEPVNKVIQIEKKPTTTSRTATTRTESKEVVTPTGGLSNKVAGIKPSVVTMNASAYCACYKCCGKSTGMTASGAKASAWYTIAAGKGYPIGTIIYIPALSNTANGGWFVVQDRGGAISNNKIDIFVGNHSEAIQFGRRNLECYVYM